MAGCNFPTIPSFKSHLLDWRNRSVVLSNPLIYVWTEGCWDECPMFSRLFWVALWSCMSPHIVAAQTDALCPRCICKNTLKLNFSWKTKPHSQHSMSVFPCPRPFMLSWRSYVHPACFTFSLSPVALLGSSLDSKMDGVHPVTAFVFFPCHGHSKLRLCRHFLYLTRRDSTSE